MSPRDRFTPVSDQAESARRLAYETALLASRLEAAGVTPAGLARSEELSASLLRHGELTGQVDGEAARLVAAASAAFAETDRWELQLAAFARRIQESYAELDAAAAIERDAEQRTAELLAELQRIIDDADR
jgi:hypothetical protein